MPVSRRVCVVGGLAAGPSAAAKAARTDPSAHVVLFEQGESISYGICELPYYISGEVRKEDLIVQTPEKMRREKNVEVFTHARVEKIDVARRVLEVRDLKAGKVREERYDRLVLATGSSPRPLGVKGEEARNVFRVKSLDDGVQIARFIESEHPSRAVIIGAGYVGVEMAEALRSRGLTVSLLQRSDLPLDHVEPETAAVIRDRLIDHGVAFVPGALTVGFRVDDRQNAVDVLTPHHTYPADLVIVAIGVQPNSQLPSTARIRLGRSGGILTDARLRTSVDNIFAAGDCCEVRNLVDHRPMYAPLATNASRMGWVAGENAAGGRADFPGALRSIALRVFETEMVHLGLTLAEARDSGFVPVTVTINARSRVHMMPGNKEIQVRLVADRASRRLLGAELCGEEGAVLRGNMLAPALQHHLTVNDIQRWDLAYAPPFSPLWDPVLVAANALSRKLDTP